MKKLIAPFVLDVLVATAGIYVAVSQLLEGFSWLAVAILATLAGANIFAAFKLGTNGRLKFSSTAAAGAVLLAWMIYVSIVSGVGALAVIGMVVGCAQIVIAVIAGKNGGLTVQRPRRIFRLSFHCLQHGVLRSGLVWEYCHCCQVIILTATGQSGCWGSPWCFSPFPGVLK